MTSEAEPDNTNQAAVFMYAVQDNENFPKLSGELSPEDAATAFLAIRGLTMAIAPALVAPEDNPTPGQIEQRLIELRRQLTLKCSLLFEQLTSAGLDKPAANRDPSLLPIRAMRSGVQSAERAQRKLATKRILNP